MFELGIITDEISQQFETALDRMVDWGIPYAELRGLWGQNVSELSSDDLRRAQRELDARGLKVCGIASPFFKCELTGGQALQTGMMHLAQDRALDEQRVVLQRCIEAAHLFETPFIRVFAFWRRGPVTPEIADRIRDLFHAPLALAREAGVTLLLENEHDCYFSTGEETAPFIASLADEGLRAVWDPGNAFCAGEERPYPDGYEALKPWIVHVHLKDPRRSASGGHDWMPLGQGDLDLLGQLNALNRDGYTGVLSIETHYAPEGGTPEQGSHETLLGLRDLIGQAV